MRGRARVFVSVLFFKKQKSSRRARNPVSAPRRREIFLRRRRCVIMIESIFRLRFHQTRRVVVTRRVASRQFARRHEFKISKIEPRTHALTDDGKLRASLQHRRLIRPSLHHQLRRLSSLDVRSERLSFVRPVRARQVIRHRPARVVIVHVIALIQRPALMIALSREHVINARHVIPRPVVPGLGASIRRRRRVGGVGVRRRLPSARHGRASRAVGLDEEPALGMRHETESIDVRLFIPSRGVASASRRRRRPARSHEK